VSETDSPATNIHHVLVTRIAELDDDIVDE
jgi:hypothetical protein